MRIILIKDVENLGRVNDVVEVKPGYGRNYLIPQGMAKIANKRNMAVLNELIQKQEAERARILAAAKATAEKIGGKVIQIIAKAGTSGKIFGSVTNIQLVDAIQEQLGEIIDRRAITLLEEVKELGSYAAEVRLHEEVVRKINFEVVEDK